MRLKANLTLFAVALIWGTGFITQGIAGRYQIAYLFNGVCFMLAAVILITFIPRSIKITHQQVKWTLIPENTMKYADFMSGVGTLKVKAATWKDYFFPEIYDLNGS